MIETLPRPVYDEIARHLRISGRRAPRDWEVNRHNEDSLTGAAFADFHTRRTRHVVADGIEWLWRVRAKKFGSGGPHSEESETGADGIVEIEIQHSGNGTLERKVLLIQAKKEWKGANPKLYEQVRKMEALAEGCSAIIDYTPEGYSAVAGVDVIRATGNRREITADQVSPLGKFLADRFLACQVGRRGVYYDSRRRLLVLPHQAGGPDAMVFPIPNRLRIEIEEIR
jgi:hypothetical protein